jgi:hypothetical protein
MRVMNIQNENYKNAGIWLLSNLVKTGPPLPYDITQLILPVVAHFLKTSESKPIVDVCCELICRLAYDTDERRNELFQLGIVPKMIELILDPTEDV